MEKEKLFAVLRLQKAKSIGTILAKKLIHTVGDVELLFKERPHVLQKIHGVGTQITKHLLDESQLQNVDNELQYVLDNKIEYAYFLDKDYPQKLKHCVDGPILFFKEGSIDFTNKRVLSVVGTRSMTHYGRDFCKQLIHELAKYDPMIVSGFAYGVDICAHKVAMENKLQTIAVLAHGLEQMYPRSHKKYMHQMHNRGGFITEFWHDENPLREHFLQRNRIVAGLSDATIVIESAEKGGSLVTADIANSYDREIFAVPGKVTDIYSKGCNNLIKQHKAHVITSSKDVIKVLGWDTILEPKREVQKQLFVELGVEEQKIYEYLKHKKAQLLDVIALECNISTFQLAAILLQLELKGVVKPLPGKMFTLL
ncbi:DNA-processing protein DprA [Flavobacteriaceae bacterium S356]|uniref:DNA-processing protein DprA n=1 Tax=Asprobacillus argus TaxID=3076534 RepID=A0ABU3LHA9_9FLAO|nr:DNA-processing protein DprA [Flavobacteriaceae bacterium S356]